jgi:hypothetical protein
MDFKLACEILEIDNTGSITLEYLKKRYHKLALLNHPDKRGNTAEANEKFQQINEAYSYLSREVSNLTEEDIQEDSNTGSEYMTFLNLFLDGLLKGKYNDLLSTMIKDIVNGYKKITVKLFEGLDKERTLVVYNFLFKYKNILYIGDDILDKVREVIAEKYKDVQIYVLNPTVDDMFSNNVYKLEIGGVIYFVPLWHSELYFDGKTGDDNIIVKCNPELPENVYIDENNNIHIVLRVPFTFSLVDQKSIVYYLGERRFDIPLVDLRIRRTQTYTFKNEGISKIIENDIYNVEDKSDIIFKLIFCM